MALRTTWIRVLALLACAAPLLCCNVAAAARTHKRSVRVCHVHVHNRSRRCKAHKKAVKKKCKHGHCKRHGRKVGPMPTHPKSSLPPVTTVPKHPTTTSPIASSTPSTTGTSTTTTTGTTTTSTSGTGSGTSQFEFFGPDSVWNEPLADDAPLDPNSTAISARLNQFISAELTAQNGPWINTTDYSTPIYTVPAGQPTVPVYMDYYNESLDTALSEVPIPADAEPAAGSDAEMTVYQPSSDTLWEMYDLRQAINPPPFLSGTVGSSGSLPAGEYYYAVTALTSTGQTTISPVESFNVSAGGAVALRWNGPVGATAYDIYRGSSPSNLELVGRFDHDTTELEDPGCVWTDTGTEEPQAISPPTTNTATTPGQWHAQWGGRIIDVSTSPGYYYNIADPAGGWLEYDNWGVTGSGLPVVGGLITLADLASGQIDHAVALMVPEAAEGTFDFPAMRTDGVDASADAIPEGARFRLPPTLDLSKLQMPPVTRMIAEAAQKYGLIVDDQTSVAVGFRAQDPTPLMREGQPNPYATYFTDPSTGAYEAPNRLLASFPWSDLELVAPPSSP